MSLTTEQLRERHDGLGASDGPAALGLSPWVTPFELYTEKTTPFNPDAPRKESDAMRFGSLLEPVIRGEYARRQGVEVIFGQPMLRSQKYRWMTANLDGWVPSTARVLECKTARDDGDWGEPGSDDVPQAYLIQVVHQMIVTGAQLADIAVLIGGSDFRVYTVPLKPELAELVIAGEEEFWGRVESRDPPAPQTLAEINLRWRQSRPRAVELSPNVAGACAELASVRADIKAQESIAERLEALIKFEMADAEAATIDGVTAVTWKQAKDSRTFDSKAFREAMPDLAAKYEYDKPGSRRFLLKTTTN